MTDIATPKTNGDEKLTSIRSEMASSASTTPCPTSSQEHAGRNTETNDVNDCGKKKRPFVKRLPKVPSRATFSVPFWSIYTPRFILSQSTSSVWNPSFPSFWVSASPYVSTTTTCNMPWFRSVRCHETRCHFISHTLIRTTSLAMKSIPSPNGRYLQLQRKWPTARPK